MEIMADRSPIRWFWTVVVTGAFLPMVTGIPVLIALKIFGKPALSVSEIFQMFPMFLIMLFMLALISVPTAFLAFFASRAQRDSSLFIARGIWVAFACILVVLFAIGWQNVEGTSMAVVLTPHYLIAITLVGGALGGCAGFLTRLLQRSRQARRTMVQ